MIISRLLACLIAIFVLSGAVLAADRSAKAPAAAADTGPVDINSATLRDIAALNGIGPVEAVKIEAGRPYTSRDELLNRNVLSATAFAAIKDHIMVGPPVDPANKPAKKKQ